MSIDKVLRHIIDGPIRSFSNGARNAHRNYFGSLALAGSFSKDIDEVEGYRVIVARRALMRFGE
ncbi:MAG: hypothetical protein BGP05_10650 [Rhizobiales bacterium 62-47]|nr:MAG: hypothetical protein BGP05_10650 [Rhizobiales bacterium 62-47]